jgi:hypothetical protein
MYELTLREFAYYLVSREKRGTMQSEASLQGDDRRETVAWERNMGESPSNRRRGDA